MSVAYGTGLYRAGESAAVSFSKAISSPRRPVVFAHSAGVNAVSDTSGWVAQLTALLAQAGYPVHAGDLGSSSYKDANGNIWNWGNADHTASVGAAVTWMNGLTRVKSDKALLVATSMGNLGILNWAKANLSSVAAIALIAPVLDLNDLITNDKGFAGTSTNSFVAPAMYGLSLPQATITLSESIATSGLAASYTSGVGGLAANKVNILTSAGIQVVTFTGISGTSITGASGGTGTLSLASWVSQGFGSTLVNAYGDVWPNLLSGAQLAANSPVVWAKTAGGLTVPVKIWASDNDFLASNTAACQAFASAVGAAGGGNTNPLVESLGSVGHSVGSLNPVEILQWFDANGGRS